MFGVLLVTGKPEAGKVMRQFLRRPGKPTLAQMQEAVGGYIETGFRMPSKLRPGVSIDFWVNDEGLGLSDNPVMQYRVGEKVYQLAGSAIVTGVDRQGETIELLDEELQQLLDSVKVQHIGWTN